MGELMQFDKVVEIVHKAFGNPQSNPSTNKNDREEVITDQQLEEMVNEAYNKFKTRTMNNSK